VPLGSTQRHARVLTDREAPGLAEIAVAIERRLSQPQSIDWCLGASGTFAILRARPIGLHAEDLLEYHPNRDVVSAGANRG
jgi:phosphoenolpyruvate synthase/pyruvate phosphate dikinase